MSEELESNEVTEESGQVTASADSADVRDPGVDNDSDAEASEPLGPPEWLPEKFWKDGQPNVEALAKSYQHLETKLGKGAEAPEAYEPPETIDPESSLYQAFANAAKEMGMSQDMHDAIINAYLSDGGDEKQKMEAHQAFLEEQYQLLGPTADKRLNGIASWSMNNLGQQDAAILDEMMMTADQVRVVERLIAASRDQRLPRRVESLAATVDGDKLKEMMAATTSNGQRRMSVDPEYRKQVEAAYAQFYGTEAAEQVVHGVR